MFLGRTVAAGVVLAVVCLAREARADEAPPDEPWRVHRIGLGLHLGAAIGAGQAANLSMSNRVGFAPMMAIELGYRLHRNFSVVALGAAGVAAKKPSPCPEAVDGFSCTTTNLFALAGMGRYHLTIGGPIEPWVGAGLGVGVLTEKAEKTETRSGSFCVVGCGGTDVITRSRNRFGPEAVVAIGASIRPSPRFSVGFGVHAFIGSYGSGTVKDEHKVGNSPASSDFDVAGGAHAVLLATGSFIVQLGS